MNILYTLKNAIVKPIAFYFIRNKNAHKYYIIYTQIDGEKEDIKVEANYV